MATPEPIADSETTSEDDLFLSELESRLEMAPMTSSSGMHADAQVCNCVFCRC